jgi:DNA invertase Pin-like site-specific DNA recombinase
MDDIERGEIDTVVVYKVDRLSRSLLDFSRLVERFEKRRVAFASITQHFDTSTSMGWLVLHILLSFAQFERELISERTRDKIAAAKRRAKWTGGPLVLGYRVDRQRRALEAWPTTAPRAAAPSTRTPCTACSATRSTSARFATTTTCSSASTSPSSTPKSSSACSAPSTCARREPARAARDGASRC